MNKKKIKEIFLKADSNREIFLIHGYGGSPTDFADLPSILNKKFNANVRVPLLNGHGTKISDLDNYYYKDFILRVEKKLKKDLALGRKIIIGGLSLGALLAIHLASKYPIEGLFDVAAPLNLKFLFNVPLINYLGKFKKYWGNIKIPNQKCKEEIFCYKQFHINGLSVLKTGNREIRPLLKNVNCPCLTIHSKRDNISHYSSAALLDNSINSKIKKLIILNNKEHNPFFGAEKERLYRIIVDFFKKNDVFKK